MVKLTCLVRRKPGMSPAEFHAYWRDHHGPLVAASRHGSFAVRYVQHHRALGDYPAGGRDDGGFDGVTEQWFASMEDYQASVAAGDFPAVWADLQRFLDVDRLAFVVTDEPVVVIDCSTTGTSPAAEPDGSTAVSDGSTAVPGGSTPVTAGSTANPDGSTAVPGGGTPVLAGTAEVPSSGAPRAVPGAGSDSAP